MILPKYMHINGIFPKCYKVRSDCKTEEHACTAKESWGVILADSNKVHLLTLSAVEITYSSEK